MISLSLLITGRVTVNYCKSHNHKLSFQDFLYRRMPDRLRNEIREKLMAGMSSEEIYKELKSTDNLRETRGERFAPSKRQFVTLVNIKTIAKRMSIKEVGSTPKQFLLDPDPYAIQVRSVCIPTSITRLRIADCPFPHCSEQDGKNMVSTMSYMSLNVLKLNLMSYNVLKSP